MDSNTRNWFSVEEWHLTNDWWRKKFVNNISQSISDFLPVATFLITGVSCVSLFGKLFAHPPSTQRAASVCVFTGLRIIRIVFLPRKAHLRPKGPIAVSWALQPTKRQHAGENILPKWAMRKIRAWISLVSSETVHPDRYECPSSGLGGRGASAFCRKMGICYGLLFMFLMTSWYLCIVVQNFQKCFLSIFCPCLKQAEH